MDERNIIEITVTSSINSFESLRRFPSDITISKLKNKLELLTGASSATMKVQLLDKNHVVLAQELEDDRELKSYSIENGMFLHVIDSSLQAGEFEDLSSVEKFELSEEKYLKRADNVRTFKQKLKAGKGQEEKIADIEKIQVGNRCEVHVSSQPARTGTVRFVGETDFKPGIWVGVEYDEPLGKNDGSCQGKRYFECPPNYGGFVRPTDILVGDFPPKELSEEI